VISDSDLATRVVLNGDTDALGELYQRHAPAIHDFLLRTTRDPALAEDLTQMTFLKAFERRAGLRDPSRVRSWLFSIASHTALDEQRQRHPADDIDQRLDLANPAPGPEDQLTSKEAAALVWSAAASLEPRQYAVLDLTVRQQLTTPEVAAVLGIDAGHAAVLVNRAKEALGKAVRYLLVARRRTHCPALSAMVPAGVRELTPEQRTSVDHHMRHCADCRTMASALTRPVEILGGIATIGLPRALQAAPGTTLPPALHAHLTAAHLSHGPQPASVRGLAKPGLRTAIRHAVTSKVLAAVAGVALVTGGTAGTVALVHRSESPQPIAAAPSTSATSSHSGGPSASAAAGHQTASAPLSSDHWVELSANPYPPPSGAIWDSDNVALVTFQSSDNGLAINGQPGVSNASETYAFNGTTWGDTGQALPNPNLDPGTDPAYDPCADFWEPTALFSAGNGDYLALAEGLGSGGCGGEVAVAEWTHGVWGPWHYTPISETTDSVAYPFFANSIVGFDPESDSVVILGTDSETQEYAAQQDVWTWSAPAGWRDTEVSVTGVYVTNSPSPAVFDAASDTVMFLQAQWRQDVCAGDCEPDEMYTWNGTTISTPSSSPWHPVVAAVFDTGDGDAAFLENENENVGCSLTGSCQQSMLVWDGRALSNLPAGTPADITSLQYDPDLGAIVATGTNGSAYALEKP
jgi:RNA polymerase sigma factor (sigma-70 family)